MANEQNLRPGEYKLTQEEQKRGGKRSAEVRRQKRDIRRALEALLEKTYTNKQGEVLSGAEIIAIKQMEKAIKGDTRAFEVVRDSSGQKPIDKVVLSEIDQEVIDEVEKAVLNESSTSD